jgi:2-isopropylmalate synthase
MKYILLLCVLALAKFASGFRIGAVRKVVHILKMTASDIPLKTTSTGDMGNFVSSVPLTVQAIPTAHDKYTGRDPNRVKIFDTTLRDGEQSPGCTMNLEEKMLVAKQLYKLGVDIIEAGFPIASEGDFEAVAKIAKSVGQYDDPPIICGLARATKKDISVCYDAIQHAKFPRIHTFIATSDIHMEHKLRKSREEVLDIVTEMVSHARSLCEDVEFSAEDALRSDPEFLYQVYARAIEAGATTLNVPDTVGYTTPAEFYTLIRGMRANIKDIDKVTISVHGHNDLGMAVANFLAAIEGGARQMECTINGIGERAGNAALEELVMGLHVRKSYYNKYFAREEDSELALTNVKMKEIYKASRLVSSITGMMVQANKAIVGANAFAHESGIHQDGVLKNKRTYEIMDAESIGLVENNIVLGKHSGRHAFRSRLNELGYDSMSDDDLNRAFIRFKEVADKKKEISNADIESIVGDEMKIDVDDRYKLLRVQIITGSDNIPTATATLYDEQAEKESTISATGTGPIDAAFKALRIQMDGSSDVKLLEYTVTSVTAGIDALGEVTVRLQDPKSGRTIFGRASHTDVFVSSSQAYINAMNRMLNIMKKDAPIPAQSGFNTL